MLLQNVIVLSFFNWVLRLMIYTKLFYLLYVKQDTRFYFKNKKNIQKTSYFFYVLSLRIYRAAIIWTVNISTY